MSKKTKGINRERRIAIMNAIPVFPEEKSRLAISREVGFDTASFFQGLSEDVMVCENKNRFSWLSQKEKDREIKALEDCFT